LSPHPDETRLLHNVRCAWAELLEVEAVPLDVGFLEAGGNSLLLVMLWEQLQGLTERQLTPTDLFKYSTVRQQVELLRGAPGDSV
jgi:hypothetical protein